MLWMPCSDLQHPLDARLLVIFLGPSPRSLGITRSAFSWSFQHALGATLLASSWNCQRSFDASLLTCSWDVENAFGAMVLVLELPILTFSLNFQRSLHTTLWAFSWNTPALSCFGFGKKLRRLNFNLMIDPCPKDFQLRLQKRATWSWLSWASMRYHNPFLPAAELFQFATTPYTTSTPYISTYIIFKPWWSDQFPFCPPAPLSPSAFLYLSSHILPYACALAPHA